MSTLYIIEVCLRELIVRELSRAIGPKWYKSALPGGNILDTYRKALTYQGSTPWCTIAPLHPIHYLDFPDLATIIERGDNWNNYFKTLFVRKDVFIAKMRAIEPMRNSVAHNRRLSRQCLSELDSTLNFIIQTIGVETVHDLVANSAKALEIAQELTALHTEIKNCLDAVGELQPLPEQITWNRLKNSWWFDTDYLGIDTQVIFDLFDTYLSKYDLLPKGWGTGPDVTRWLAENALVSSAASAIESLERLIRLSDNYERHK